MDNVIVLGNGFDIDLGLKTSFKRFVESFDFLSIPDIPLIKKIKERSVENWCDLEGLLRNELIAYSLSPSVECAEDVNNAWLMITKVWGRYLPELTDLDKISINKNSCAYHLLLVDEAHESFWYTFNYTNPWHLCKMYSQKKAVYIHNENIPLDWAKHHGFMYQASTNLIIGVDNMVPPCISSGTHLSHIIKTKNPHFQKGMKENVVERLFTADNVVIFGQSLGITDSDYFKPYLTSVINGETDNKNIFIVTYNNSSLNGIKNNMSEYDINFDDITKSKVNINIVFTERGITSYEFQMMITELYKNSSN